MTEPMPRDAFVAAVTCESWSTIDDLVARLDDADFWDDAFLARSVDERKKAYIRRTIKQLKGDDGAPLFHSIVWTDPVSGGEVRVYKQEAMFDIDDYRQAIRYYRGRAAEFEHRASRLEQRVYERYGVQMHLTELAPTG